MAIRYLKIILVFFVGLQGLLYGCGNTANWDVGHSNVAYVLGMVDHTVYPSHIAPTITNPSLVTLAFLIILTGEALVGLLSLKGAWDLWRERKASSANFNASKNYALLGAGMAMVVWFGGFMVIGGAWFQMWQTPIGDNSFRYAFDFAATGGLVMLFISRPDT